MLEHPFDGLIREKLAQLQLPATAADWAEMAAYLDDAFDAEIRSTFHTLHLPLSSGDWAAMVTRLDEVFDQEIRARLLTAKASGASDDWPIMAALLAEQPFDAALLKRLLTLQLTMSPGDWEAMARLLDDDVLLSQLREALENWSEPLSPRAWPAMREVLDHTFDNQVREKIEELPPVDDTMVADWGILATALDGGGFDQSIRDGLADLEMGPESHDWIEMENRLSAPLDAQLREKLGSHQVQSHVTDMAEDWDRLHAAIQAPVRPLYQPAFPWRRALAVAGLVMLFLTAGSLKRWRDSRQVQFAANSTQADSTLGRPVYDAWIPGTASPSQAITQVEAAADDRNDHGQVIDFVAGKSQLRPIPALNTAPPEIVLPTDRDHQASLAQPLRESAVAQQAEHTRSKTVNPLDWQLRQDWALASPFLHGQSQLAALLPSDSRLPEIRIGLMGSMTKTKAELSGPSAQAGYLSGLRIELIVNPRWQVISGLAYGVRHFSHTYYTAIHERLYPNALDATMRLVELPLMIRYQFPSESNLSLYVQGGIVTVLSIEETYNHYDPSAPINGVVFNPVPRRLQPSEQAWSLNTYPGNVQAAIGLRYELGERWMIHVEPFFQQSLQRTKGSGALGLEKKLYTTGLSIGTSVKLGQVKR